MKSSTYRDLGEDVHDERQHGQKQADPLPAKTLPHVLGQGVNLWWARMICLVLYFNVFLFRFVSHSELLISVLFGIYTLVIVLVY